MIERDYIMRILKQFFDVLQELINNIDPSKEEVLGEALNELCERFLGNNISYYLDSDDDNLVSSLGQGSGRELLASGTMLAEVLYHKVSSMDNVESKVALARKVLILLNYINVNSDTYSFERLHKIAEMEQLLS